MNFFTSFTDRGNLMISKSGLNRMTNKNAPEFVKFLNTTNTIPEGWTWASVSKLKTGIWRVTAENVSTGEDSTMYNRNLQAACLGVVRVLGAGKVETAVGEAIVVDGEMVDANE